jgi:hypothetical protein
MLSPNIFTLAAQTNSMCLSWTFLIAYSEAKFKSYGDETTLLHTILKKENNK